LRSVLRESSEAFGRVDLSLVWIECVLRESKNTCGVRKL